MTFSIIGTGNIAWFIGNRLVAARHYCKGVFGRDPEAVSRLADSLLCANFGTIAEARESEADVCFLAVSDVAIKEVAEQLNFKKSILVHTAGAVPMEILMNAAPDCAVLWPVYSISAHNLPAHRNIPCAWEASSPKAEKYTLALAHAITDILFEAHYDQRRWLHLSAVICNNFTNHLMAICEQICVDNNIPFSALEPVIQQTFTRIKQYSPTAVQTGPAIRHDVNTIAEQLAMLSGQPYWQKVYEALTESIQHNEKTGEQHMQPVKR